MNKGMTLGLSLIIGLVAILASVTLALVVDEDSEGPQGDTAGLQSQIDELMARTDYIQCTWNADAALEEARIKKDSVYTDYLANNATYAAYERAYDAYEHAYDVYDKAMNECWEAYQDA